MAISPLSTVTAWFQRAPIALPQALDHTSEWFWRQPSRVRLATPFAVLAVALLVVNPFTQREDSVQVLVTNRDVLQGMPITQNDVITEVRPRRFVPPAHLATAAGVASHMIPAGTVLVQHHVTDGGASAQLPDTHVAVAFHRDVLPPVSIGDRVTLVDVLIDGQAHTVAHAVMLFHQDDDVLWFAVPQQDAVPVAAAAHHGRISAIVHPRNATSRR